MNIVAIEALPGYDKELEQQRKTAFDAFMKAKDNKTKRRHFNLFAAITGSRSPSLVNALDSLQLQSILRGCV